MVSLARVTNCQMNDLEAEKQIDRLVETKVVEKDIKIGVKHEKAVNMRPKEMFEESLGIHGNFQTDAETVKQIDIYKLRRNLPTQI